MRARLAIEFCGAERVTVLLSDPAAGACLPPTNPTMPYGSRYAYPHPSLTPRCTCRVPTCRPAVPAVLRSLGSLVSCVRQLYTVHRGERCAYVRVVLARVCCEGVVRTVQHRFTSETKYCDTSWHRRNSYKSYLNAPCACLSSGAILPLPLPSHFKERRQRNTALFHPAFLRNARLFLHRGSFNADKPADRARPLREVAMHALADAPAGRCSC